MASQLRLHVLLPLAFLGLIGAAFGVYTMGKAPGGGKRRRRPAHHDAPGQDQAEARPRRPTEWVEGPRSLVRRLPGPVREDRRAAGARRLRVGRRRVRRALGRRPARIHQAWPSVAEAGRLRSPCAGTSTRRRPSCDGCSTGIQALDVAAIENQLDELDALDSERVALTRQLGAGKCLDEKNKGVARLAIQQAPLLINSQLRRYGKVVVLFYEPGANYDAIQTREARAGALLAHAGFVVGERVQEPRGGAARLAVQRAAVAHRARSSRGATT